MELSGSNPTRLRPSDIRFALAWIVLRQWQISEAAIVSDNLHHLFAELLDRKLAGVTQIDRLMKIVCIHQANQTFQQITHVTKRACLLTFAVKSQ